MKHQTILLSGYSARTERAGPLMLGTAGSYGNEQLQIRRGNGWEALNVRVVFHPCGAELLVPEDGILTVPWEATDSPLDRGQGRIVFQGVSEGRVIHTADLFYEVRPHSPVPGQPPREHVPVLSEELLKRVYEIGAAAENSARSAQNAEASAALASDSARTARNAQSEAENSAKTAETYARAAASSAEEAKKASGLALDTTLTEDGKAADAKAAGDAVRTLKLDVDDCVRNIIAETDWFEQSIPAENQGLIEDAGNVLIVHGNSETFGIPLLSDYKNQIPSPYNLNITSSNGVTFSSYYRYLTINADGTGTGLVTSYLTGSRRVSLSETDLQAGDGFILMIHKNKDYPDSGKPIMRVQFFNSAGSQAKYYDVTFGDSNTFISNVYAIPDTAVSFRIAIRIPSDAVYDNVTFYPILIPSNAVLRELGTEALADGAKVELPYSEIAEFSSVNTFNYDHSYRYKIDAKTYIDNHVSEVKMTYTTPEDFGAVGDGIADDSTAIEQCIAYGAEQQIPIRMNQTYLITSSIWINSAADIEINRLIYTGTDAAVIVNSSSNRIHIGSLTSGGIGVVLRGVSNNVEYNRIFLGMVSSKSHCISLETPSKPVVNNVIEFRQLKAGGDGCYCITNVLNYNSYNTENTFIGGNCTYADWAFYGSGANNKFYSFNVENYIKGGFCFLNGANAIIVGDRHAEAQRDGEYPFIKIKCDGAANNSSASAITALRYISPLGLRVNEIDVSEAATTQVAEDGQAERSLLSNGSLGRIDCRIISYTNSGTNSPNSGSNFPKRYQSFGESCLIWGNTLIFQDTPHKYYTVTESLDLRTITEDTPAMPSVFEIACENCEIHLHPTYCFLGIKKFEVIQTETHQAEIYDYFTSSLVFDGAQYGAGTFEVSTYLNGDCARINGENMVWRIRKIC